MNDSALDILAGTFKKQETLTDANTYTFESKITVLDKNIGAGCPVHVFEKATGTLIYTTETDSESFIYVPNLLKNVKYFVVATDKNDMYSSIIFDLNWDFAQQSGNKYNLKYYNKYQSSSSKDIYTYMDTVSDLVYDPSLLYSISVPFQKEDQKATWFGTGVFNVENIDGFPSFSFKGSASTYTYINFTPVQTGDSFTVECYIRPLALFSGKTVAGGVFSQNTSQGLFISDDFRLSYRNKNLTINTISTLEADTWYHVAVSYDSKRIRLFLNGKKEAETEDSIGLEYLSTVFCVGAGFYGYLSGFKIFQESKYEDDFTPNFRPFGYLPVIYSNEEDPYANNTVLKSYISDSGYLKDKAKNTPLSFDYTIPKDSYIISNNSFIRTPTQYTDLALNGDFTIEVKFRLLYRTGTNPVICGNKANKADWVTNNWHLHADHPNQLEKYGLSIYGGNYNNSLANYPTIYNEPVSLVLQRKGTTYSYYFNGFADRSFTYATAMDTRTSSYFSIGGDTSFELYDIKITKGVARYSENYKDEQLQGSETLLKAYYQIVNYPFKESLYDARNALAFVNTGVLLTSARSSYKTKSALFANSYFVTSKSYWYTPNESFTVEFKISCKSLPLKTAETVNTATLFSIFTATSDNFKLAIRDKYLSFYNGIEWLDSEFELDDEDTFKHIVLQRNSTSIKILAEGSLVLETTCPDLAGRRNVSIGANKAGSDTFNGYMNNLFIYKNYCKYEDNYEVPQDPDEHVPTDEEKEPNVLITPYTTSALNFENGIIDRIGTTVWQKEGTADITSTNKIFGDNSFETKALGDSLYTNNDIITGGSTPFTVEFYILYKSKYVHNNSNWDAPVFTRFNDSDVGNYLNTNTYNISYHSVQQGLNDSNIIFGKNKIKPNEITKFTMSYDGSCIRTFVNDNIDNILGSNIGFYKTVNSQFRFFSRVSSNNEKSVLCGILDNINIHDGIATKVRDPDPYEDYLAIDLAFDGQNDSTKIVDNAKLPTSEVITDKYNDFVVSLLNFDNGLVHDEVGNSWASSGNAQLSQAVVSYGTGNSFYSDGSYNTCLYMSGNIPKLNTEDFCVEMFYTPTNITSFYSFFNTYGYGNTSERNIVVSCSDGILTATFINTTTGDASLELNKTYHIAYTRKGNTFRLFKNGVLVGTGSSSESIRTDAIFIAIQPYNPSWTRSGYYDEFRITKGVSRYTDNFSVPSEKFKYVRPHNTWTVSGNAKLSTTQPFDGFSSLYLDGSSMLSLNDNNIFNFDQSDFTINFDMLPTDNSQYNIILSSDQPTVNGNLTFIAIGSNTDNTGRANKLYIFEYLYNNGGYTIKTFKDIPFNIITNIKIIKKNSILYIFINNILDSQIVHNRNFNLTYNISTLLGGSTYESGNKFKGYIKNFKVYKGVAVIPEDPTGKIQLDFDNNVIDKYGNSTWTNNGVTFDQVNSVKGHAAYFNGSSKLTSNTQNLNFENKPFYIEADIKRLSTSQPYSAILSNSNNNSIYHSGYIGFSYNSNNMSIIGYNDQYYNINLFKNNGDSVNLKINDVCIGAINNLNTLDFSNAILGAGTNTNNYFTGYIDNFKSTKNPQEPVVIDKPAVHLPLETNVTNIGFTPLTINSVGNPTYTTIDGKKCIKFESGKYLTINSNNIFNLGTNSDFYIEFEFYPLDIKSSGSKVFFTSGANYASGALVFSIYQERIILQMPNFPTTNNIVVSSDVITDLNKFYKIKLARKGTIYTLSLDNSTYENRCELPFNLSVLTTIGTSYWELYNATANGYMSNFKMFVGTSEIPETYNDKKVLDLDFAPTGKSYLFKDNNNKCVIHPVNITQRDYQDSQYCCTFNGTNQYLQLGKNDLFNFGLDDFVIYFKVRIDNITPSNKDDILLSNNISWATGYIGIGRYRQTNKLSIGVYGTPGYNSSNTFNLGINDIIITRNGSNLTINLNGIETVFDNFTASANFNGNNSTRIGMAWDAATETFFSGTIYSIKVLRNTSDLSLLNDKTT